MTKNELIRRRERRKRTEQTLRIAVPTAAAALLICIAVPLLTRKKIQVPPKGTKTQENVDTDTAEVAAADEKLAGSPGWNVGDSGWWYLNDDGTTFRNGWKTIDGQRYYFKSDGYMATGWVNTGNVKDLYFDASGVVDPSRVQKLVALTYDDGPSKHTDDVLDAMEKHGAKCTFFVVGQQAEYWKDQLKREADLGMEIGSHTYDHQWLTDLDADGITDEMNHNDEVISGISGVTPPVMRPTGGLMNATVVKTIQKPMILWDVDTLDWKTKDDDTTYQTIMDQVKDGSIVLMHDLYAPSGNIADKLISSLTDQGYKCVTVSELAKAYGYDLEPGSQYYAMYPGGYSLNMTREQALAKYESGDDG